MTEATPTSRRRSSRDYTVRQAEFPRDRDAVLELWEGNLGTRELAERKLDWWYSDPSRQPLVLLLYCQGELVGMAAGTPRRFRTPHGEEAGIQFGDFTVRPAFRSLFPALTIHREMYQLASRTATLMYAFPNPQARAVLRRAGDPSIGNLVRRNCVVRASSQLRRFVPLPLAVACGCVIDVVRRVIAYRPGSASLEVQTHTEAPAGIDAVWERMRGARVIVGERSRRFASFRFDGHAGHVHRYVVLQRRGAQEPLGWFVYEVEDAVWHVHDWLVMGLEPADVADCLCTLQRLARAAGARALSLWFCGPDPLERVLARSGFIARESAPIFGKLLPPDADRVQGVPWYFTRADLDG